VVATHNPRNEQVAIFMLNRDTTGEREVTIAWQSPMPSKVLACQTLTGPDRKAGNTFEQPNNVVPRSLDAPQPGSSMTFRLPAGSYTVAHLATAG
jgi:alpha-L-arabinofuranosidase